MARKITTGVEKAYFAILDNENGVNPVYKPVSYLQGLQEFSIVANEESSTIYAENRLWESENGLGEIEVSLTFASIYTEDYVALLGKKLSVGGGIIESADDEAPYIALMLEKTLSGGVKEYLTLYKGKLRIPEDVARTKEGTTEFQVKTLAGTFMASNNGVWKHVVKSDDVGFNKANHEAKWGKEVIIPSELEKAELKVLTSIPVANGGAFPKADNVVLDFSNALISHEVTLVDDTQKPVSFVASLDEAKKKLSINPNAELAGGKKHTVTVVAKDIFGQVASYTNTFTTAQ